MGKGRQVAQEQIQEEQQCVCRAATIGRRETPLFEAGKLYRFVGPIYYRGTYKISTIWSKFTSSELSFGDGDIVLVLEAKEHNDKAGWWIRILHSDTNSCVGWICINKTAGADRISEVY